MYSVLYVMSTLFLFLSLTAIFAFWVEVRVIKEDSDFTLAVIYVFLSLSCLYLCILFFSSGISLQMKELLQNG